MKSISEVKQFQFFLIGQGFYKSKADGDYGKLTIQAVKDFQSKYGLQADGIAGRKTLNKALELGFMRDSFPLKPDFKSITTTAERQRIFGKFAYEASNDLQDKDAIRIKGTWEDDNIVTIQIPQLLGVKGSTNVRCHKLAASQMIALFAEWEHEDLMKYILTWEGCFYPRFVRGRYGVLSNHSWGTAFDINYEWNKLGVTPAYVGQEGSIRLLVEIANKHGFYWGGHFDRRDGMHMELTKIVKK
jgi:peptidoglycan hydrolase-like protein with peptidoglycan-binding domain